MSEKEQEITFACLDCGRKTVMRTAVFYLQDTPFCQKCDKQMHPVEKKVIDIDGKKAEEASDE
jgi:predicted RNA-binding Zn-ribbon protein involved in translation (DUF1610 family)